ncbi:MAG: potassium channel family protein [Candidatus Binataceae bacterium]
MPHAIAFDEVESLSTSTMRWVYHKLSHHTGRHTISTVGVGEVKPLSPDGRVFTIGLTVTGVGSTIYLLSAIGELVVEGRLERVSREERDDSRNFTI